MIDQIRVLVAENCIFYIEFCAAIITGEVYIQFSEDISAVTLALEHDPDFFIVRVAIEQFLIAVGACSLVALSESPFHVDVSAFGVFKEYLFRERDALTTRAAINISNVG